MRARVLLVLVLGGMLTMAYDFGPSPFAALRSRTLAPNPSKQISIPGGFTFTGQKPQTGMRVRQRGGSTLQPFEFDLGDVASTIGGANILGRDFGTPGGPEQAGAEAQGAPAGIMVATDRPSGLLRAPIGAAPRAMRPPQPPPGQPSPEAPPGPEGPSELEQVFARTQQIVSAAKGAGKLVSELVPAKSTLQPSAVGPEFERRDLSATTASPFLPTFNLGITPGNAGPAPATFPPGTTADWATPQYFLEPPPMTPAPGSLLEGGASVIPASYSPGGEGARFETGSPTPSAAAPTVSPLPGGGSPGTPSVTPSGTGDAFMQGTGAGFGLADVGKAYQTAAPYLGAATGALNVAGAVESGNVAQGVSGGIGLAQAAAQRFAPSVASAAGPYLAGANIALGIATHNPNVTVPAVMGAANPVLGLAAAGIMTAGSMRDANTEKQSVHKAKFAAAAFQNDPDVQALGRTLGQAKAGNADAVASVQRAMATAMTTADAFTRPANSNPNALAPVFKAIYGAVIGTPAFGSTVIAAAKALNPSGPWDQGYEKQVSYAYDFLNEVGYGSPAFYGPPPGYDPNLGTGRGLAEASLRSMAPATSTPSALPNLPFTGAPTPPGYARGGGYQSGQLVPTAFPAVPGMEPPAGFVRGTGMNSGQFVPILSGGAFGR